MQKQLVFYLISACALAAHAGLLAVSLSGRAEIYAPVELISWVIVGLLALSSLRLFLVGLWRHFSLIESSFAGLALAYTSFEFIIWAVVAFGLIAERSPDFRFSQGIPVVPYFDEPCAAYDSISGFRWSREGCRTVKVANGLQLFDQQVRPNAQGFISDLNYEFHKADTNTRRYAVLGDSYSDGYYLEKNWVDRMNEEAVTYTMPELEFYNFALNGAGISTWNSLFFREIVPKYEFDALVIAAFGNDFARDPFVFHHTDDTVAFGWINGAVEKGIDQVWHDPNLTKQPLILAEDEIDLLLGKTSPAGIQLHFSNWLSNQLQRMRKLRIGGRQLKNLHKEYLALPPDGQMPVTDLKKKYGERHHKELIEILDYCLSKNIPVYLVSVPELAGVYQVSNQLSIQLNHELADIQSSYMNSVFIDGYAAFAKQDEQWQKEAFLPYDGHWSQKGSDFFAEVLFREIVLQPGSHEVNR